MRRSGGRGPQPPKPGRGPARSLLRAHRRPGHPAEETVDAFAGLAERGTVGMLGASNTATWRIERARGLAQRRPAYSCVQQRHTYLPARSGPGEFDVITEELKDLAATENLTLFAYSPLLGGPTAIRASRFPPPTTTRPRGRGWPPCTRSPRNSTRARTRWCSPGCCAATRPSSPSPVPAAWPSLTRSSRRPSSSLTTLPAGPAGRRGRVSVIAVRLGAPRPPQRPAAVTGKQRLEIHQSSSPIPPPASAPSTVSVSQCAAR